MTGQAFMYTPLGAVEIPDEGVSIGPLGMNGAEMVGAAVPTIARHASNQATVQAQVARPVVTANPLRPADVVRAAKSRVKEIRTEIRRLKALEKELGELERLIAAAKQKPVAIVRNIDHARSAR